MASDFHKTCDIDRLYLPRKLGRSGVTEIMMNVEQYTAKQQLTQIHKNNK